MHSSNINQIYLGNFVHEWEGGHIAHEVTEIPIYSREFIPIKEFGNLLKFYFIKMM